jgi:hypothetical protein
MKKSTASGSRRFSTGQTFFEAHPISRLNYFFGRLLTADDFTTEQKYHREKQRLHNLHCHGPGVVQGLKVSTAHKNSGWTVTIGPGVAIDPAGNEIQLCTTAKLPLPASPTALQVGIRFSERLSAPIPSISDPASPSSQASRVEEGCEVVLGPLTTPGGSRAKGKGLDISPDVLPLAHLVRVRGAWRVNRKFKVPRSS